MQKFLTLFFFVLFFSSITASAQTTFTCEWKNKIKQPYYIFRFEIYDNLLADSGMLVKYHGHCDDHFFVKRNGEAWREKFVSGSPHRINITLHKTLAKFSCSPERQVYEFDYTTFVFHNITEKPGTVWVRGCEGEIALSKRRK